MSFPPSVQQVTVSAGAAGYHAPDGSPCVGTIRFTPSVPRVVSAEHGVIALGPVNATLSASGMFTAELLAVDAEGFEPSGWTYRVDEEFLNAPGHAWNVSLPAAAPVVDLPSLSPVSSSSGTVQETGAAAALAIHSADTTNVHGIADTSVLETQSGAQSKANSAQSAATTAAAGDATAKVGAHAAATDPHGDRAWADNKFATELDLTAVGGTVNSLSTTVTAIDGYLNDALNRVAAIEQGTAFLDGGHFTGDVEVIDADLSVRTSSGDVGKLRPTPWLFDVTDTAYGAKGDGKVVADGAMASGSATLTSASANFQAGDVGKAISVKGAAATGVTTLVTTIAARVSATQVTLAATAATAVTSAVVIWGTDDTAAIQAAVDAAEAYLAGGRGYAQVHFPPRPYIVAGPLSSAKSGNGQIIFGVYPVSGAKKILEFRGETDGAAAVRHWQQTVPQHTGSCLISLGVFASTAAQISSLNAHGNPGVISGPNEGSGYGAAALYSNVMPVLKNLTILTTHSAYGLTYGAATLWGCANAHLENFGYGTAGTVASPSTDYVSPGTFGTGLSVGLLLPAPGNNDNVIARNISCGGGYTYALFMTEHTVMDRYMALYCWAGLCAVGNYAGSVGSVHAMKVISASIEACTKELYIIGVGSSGVGPIIDIDQLSTENSAPTVDGNSPAAMNAALGRVRFTGLFNEAGVNVTAPTGIELVNGQIPRAIKRKTGSFTCSPIDRTLVCDTTAGGAFTGTLPDAAFNPVEYTFKNIGASPLTVAAAGGQLIYASSGTGAATATVPTGQTLRVQALFNGSAWGWYAIGQPSVDLTSDQTIAGNKTFSYYTVLEGGQVNGEFHLLGSAAFFGATPVGRQTVAGAKGGNTALASLITALANLGLVTDTTT